MNRIHPLRLLVAFVAIFVSSRAAFANWPNDPSVNVPVAVGPGTQWLPDLAPDGSGGSIIVWMDDPSAKAYVQRIGPTGDPQWARNGVPVSTDFRGQQHPHISSDGVGGALVTWVDFANPAGAYVQRIDAAGIAQWGPGIRLGNNLVDQVDPLAVSDGHGGAIVVWANGAEVYAQRVDSAATLRWPGDGVQISKFTNYEIAYPAIVTDGVGGAIVAWESDGVYSQRVDSDGQPLWVSGGVSLDSGFDYQHVAIVDVPASGAIVVFQSRRPGAGEDVFAQRLDGDGRQLWTPGGVTLCRAVGDQTEIRIVADGLGGAIAAWRDNRVGVPSAPDLSDIYAQRVNASGMPLWETDGTVVCDAPGFQANPAPVSDGAGGVVVGWADGRNTLDNQNLYAQRITSDGSAVWTKNGVAVRSNVSDVGWPSGLPAQGNGAVFVWNDGRNGLSDIYAQRVNGDGVLGADVVATQLALIRADFRDSHVHLMWYAAWQTRAELYRRTGDRAWLALGALQSDGSGQINYEDSDVTPGLRYQYRLGVVEGGIERYFGEASVDVPGASFALQDVFPNPSPGNVRVRFSLSGEEPARVEVLSVSGRRIVAEDVGGLGAGVHVLELFDRQRLPAGVYFLRLVGEGRVLRRKILVLR